MPDATKRYPIETSPFVPDLTEEQVEQELELIEKIAYTADLYGVPEPLIRRMIRKQISLKQLDELHELVYTLPK